MTSSNKLILSALLSAAFIQPAVASDVTVYGVADVGVSVTNFGAGRQTAVVSGAEDGSRIGFKGTEDIGGGYKAIFTLEARVEFDTGAQSNAYLSDGLNAALFRGLPAPVVAGLVPAIGRPARIVNKDNALFDRQAFVGLITPVGAVLLGRQYTSAYEVVHTADVFESGSAGSWVNLSYVNGNAVTPSLALRTNNAIQYRIEAKGIIASVMVAPEAGSGSIGAAKRAMSANVIYRANGFDAGLGYYTEQDQVGNDALTTYVAGGSYKFTNAKVFAGYIKAKNDSPAIAGIVAPAVGPAFAAIVGQNARVDGAVATLGVQYPVGPGTVKVGLSHYRNRRTADADSSLVAVGYDYALSKRTNLYGIVAHARNQSQAQTGLGGSGYFGGSTAYPGASANAIQCGIRSLF